MAMSPDIGKALTRTHIGYRASATTDRPSVRGRRGVLEISGCPGALRFRHGCAAIGPRVSSTWTRLQR